MGVGCALTRIFPSENGHREQALEKGGHRGSGEVPVSPPGCRASPRVPGPLESSPGCDT